MFVEAELAAVFDQVGAAIPALIVIDHPPAWMMPCFKIVLAAPTGVIVFIRAPDTKRAKYIKSGCPSGGVKF